jgi:hypothetical protein
MPESVPPAVWTHGISYDAERRFVDDHGHVNEITAGTILEYDDWQWAIVTELAQDSEKPMVGFVLLDELSDDVYVRIEEANGCRQHYAAVEEFRDGEHEYWAPVEYVVGDEIWSVLGPIHPEFREEGGENDG